MQAPLLVSHGTSGSFKKALFTFFLLPANSNKSRLITMREGGSHVNKIVAMPIIRGAIVSNSKTIF
jgi:hypothetical protein